VPASACPPHPQQRRLPPTPLRQCTAWHREEAAPRVQSPASAGGSLPRQSAAPLPPPAPAQSACPAPAARTKVGRVSATHASKASKAGGCRRCQTWPEAVLPRKGRGVCERRERGGGHRALDSPTPHPHAPEVAQDAWQWLRLAALDDRRLTAWGSGQAGVKACASHERTARDDSTDGHVLLVLDGQAGHLHRDRGEGSPAKKAIRACMSAVFSRQQQQRAGC